VNSGIFLQVALTPEHEGSAFIRNVGQLPPPHAESRPADRHPQVHCRENLATRGLINTHPFIYATERETRTVEDRSGKAFKAQENTIAVTTLKRQKPGGLNPLALRHDAA
jgi:hypothetical protein